MGRIVKSGGAIGRLAIPLLVQRFIDMSSSSSLSFLSVCELSDRIAAKELSPVDLIEACLAEIARQEPQLHAFVDVYADQARVAAAGAAQAIQSGHRIGPLHGIPIVLKDLIEIEGRVATGGRAAWHDRRATQTATLARRLIEQGAIVLGKTHMVEFAIGGWGTNQHMGTPHNPWDLAHARIPGGSSSGSGVAVASGMAPWAIGTDTGGSVRLPASWCNLTALKVSTGRISTHGVLPLSPTLDTPGPMARSVKDAALLYRAIQGPDPLDRHTLGLPQAAADAPRSAKGLRLARFPAGERAVVAPDVLAAYDRSLDEFQRAGAQIVDIDLPYGFDEVAQLNGQIMTTECYALVGHLAEDSASLMDENVRRRVLAGRSVPAYAYFQALQKREKMKAEMRAVFDGIDALLSPTTATPALLLEEVDEAGSPGYFTRFANFFDLCALALPNGATAQGLPLSLQIMGKSCNEAAVLAIGQFYQDMTDWHERTPPRTES
jgi:aspartyl-tRNA(Asn)/glutamyl-tRNA(Gln) amidotransferase subunit A